MHTSRRAAAMRSSEIRDLLRLADRPDVISLAGGLPDPDGFPVEEMAAVAADLLATTASAAPALQYSSTEGLEPLRAWIAARHAAATGRPTGPDDVLVTTGSQQGLDLLGRVLGDPGDVVVAESPGYLGALQALRAAGLDLVGIDVHRDGLRVHQLADRLDHGLRPRIVYTVPTFQNPTGTTLPDDRRRALAALADEHGFVVIEDSPYAALRFRGEAVRPVAAHSDRVLSLGTFSKTLAPGLRLGWIVGPPEVIEAAVRAKQAVDLHTSGLSQHVALRLVERDDWYDRHVARLAGRYGERAAALRAALVGRLGHRLEVTDPDGGMFLWATPRPGSAPIDARALLPLAIEAGTAFVPGDAFAAGDPAPLRGAMRLSFATAPPGELVVAVDRLATAIGQLDGRPRPRMSRGPLSQVK